MTSLLFDIRHKELDSCSELSEAFQVLNGSYRKVIEALSMRCGKQSTLSLQELELQIMNQSVLSEEDMVIPGVPPLFHGHARLRSRPRASL